MACHLLGMLVERRFEEIQSTKTQPGRLTAWNELHRLDDTYCYAWWFSLATGDRGSRLAAWLGRILHFGSMGLVQNTSKAAFGEPRFDLKLEVRRQSLELGLLE